MTDPTRGRYPNLERERRLLRRGFFQVAGLDEAGRGAWAGPLSAGAVILPLQDPALRTRLAGVRDSKLMTPRARTAASERIRSVALSWSVGSASAEEVDRLGPLEATRLAMLRAIQELPSDPDHLLIDYLTLPGSALPQTAVTHGDLICLSIAAASILAKTWRDEQMVALERVYRGYGFSLHKGYGTRMHTEALFRLGACPEHRQSYAPLRRLAGSAPV